jgi:aerobic carbon-monoxide dehydrogenase small subunit
MNLAFTLNGKQVQLETSAKNRLLDILRDDFGLIGTKEGCGKGECGSCTVLIDGKRVNSCLVPALQLAGTHIITIEGMSDLPVFAEIEKAFIEHGAVQCGLCIPGFVMSTVAFLNETAPHQSVEAIKYGIAGNLCRCTGYEKIIDTVHELSGNSDLSAKIRKVLNHED